MIFLEKALKIKVSLSHPGLVFDHLKYKLKKDLLWNYYYKKFEGPKMRSFIDNSDYIKEIEKELIANKIDVHYYNIDLTEYYQYLNDAKYHEYPYLRDGKDKNFPEKSLEHFLAYKLLNLKKNDVYIDIANAGSPTPEIYKKLSSCATYRQDLIFPNGLNGNIIGGDAGNMPISNGFATKMALHCSFEHFEGDSDMLFIKEANRILRPGGKLCILPLYLFTRYAIQTDPAYSSLKKYEKNAIYYCAKGYGNKHGRFYDVTNFINRIVNNMGDLRLKVFRLENVKEVDADCYLHFAALFERC